jgi:hypothetical protein
LQLGKKVKAPENLFDQEWAYRYSLTTISK